MSVELVDIEFESRAGLRYGPMGRVILILLMVFCAMTVAVSAHAACNTNQGFIHGGTEQVNESVTNVQYSFSCNGPGTPTLPITWQIQAGADFATISSSGQLTPKAVSQNRVVTIRATDGSNATATRQITIVNNVATLDSAGAIATTIFMNGQHYVNKGTYQQEYVAVINGVSTNLTSATGLTWSVSGGGAISGGLLNTNSITANTTLTVSATYSHTPTGYPHLARSITLTWPSIRARAVLPKANPNERRVLLGPDTVGENLSPAAQFTEYLVWSDNSQTQINPIWSENSPFASIDSNGVMSTTAVNTPQQVIITTSFAIYPTFPDYPDYAAVESMTYSGKPVTIANTEIALTGLIINGPSVIDERSTALYTATALFDDSSDKPVLPFWSANSPVATISSLGDLTSTAVTANQNVTVSASYTEGGVTRTDSKLVTITNSESLLLNVSINGPTVVNENASASYTATGIFDDGSRPITPLWSVDSPYASIDEHGLLVADSVVANESVQISAVHTHLGARRQAVAQVMLVNSERVVDQIRIVGKDNVLVGTSSSRFLAWADFDDGVSSEPIEAQWSVKMADESSINPADAQVAISAAGMLTVTSINQSIDVVVHASYTNSHSSGNQTVTASRPLSLVVSHDGDGLSERVSVNAEGGQIEAGSHSPSVSADGRFVVFASSSTDLIPGDANEDQNIFLYDRHTGDVRRLSVDFSDSVIGGDGPSGKPRISANGRVITFVSEASNLVPGDGNAVQDVFIYDRITGALERGSFGVGGAEADGASDHPAVSADGRYVAFSSLATNLIPSDSNAQGDVFVYDRVAGQIERVSLPDGGGQANGSSHTPSISGDGRYVAFVSGASNLVAADTNSVDDIFIRDRASATTERVSLSTGAAQGNGASGWPTISDDGRYVAFSSTAGNLIDGDTNGVNDVFVRDRQEGTTVRASEASNGQQGNGQSIEPSISSNGRYLAFSSDASNLVADDDNNVRDVFVHDLDAGETRRLSTGGGASEAAAASGEPMLSADGLHVVFSSSASQLVPGDTNGGLDVFLRSMSAALATPRIWVEVPGGEVGLEETFTVDLLMDFNNDPTLGGGIDLAYDGSALLFESFTADPALGGDPAFSRAPDVLSVSLAGLAFGEFDGIAGARRIGTFTFTARSVGVTNLALSGNASPMGGFYSARTMTEQAIAFSGGSITTGGGLGALHITSAPVTSAEVDVLYNYDVDAVAGSGGGPLAFSLQTAPSGMTINAATGLISWTPAATGSYPVVVQVGDGGASITQGYAVVVGAGSEGSGTVTHTSTEDFEAGSGSGVMAADDGLSLSPSASDLVGLWHLDNSWADASGSGQNGTSHGGAGFTSASKVGSHAAIFDGVDDYASWNADGLLPGGAGSDLTVSLWFKYEHENYGTLISQVGDYMWSIEAAGGGPMVSYLETGAGMSQCDGSSNANDGAWHHYALVFNDTANSVTGYLDGDLDCSATTNLSLGPITSGNSLQMGAYKDISNYVQYHFEGALDEVAIYNRALSAGEVAALAATPAVSVGYTTEGSYLSGVIDLGVHDGLSTLSFTATTPIGTTLAVDVRAGDTPAPPVWGSPNADWPSGAVINNVQSGVTDNIAALGTRRYVQYRVRMTSSGDDTPVLSDITIQSESSSTPGSAPLVTSSPVRSASVGVLYSYDVDAVAGSGGGALSYTLDTAPSGMTINAGTGVIQWTPTTGGNYNVVVRVSDAGAFVTQGYTLTVSGGGTGGGSVTHTTEQDFDEGEGDGILVDGGSLRLSSSAADLVGLWHLDNSWVDASSSGQGGSSYGGAGFTTSSKAGSHAAVFDGVNDYASWSADGFLPGGAGSNVAVSLWFKYEHENYGTLISQAGDYMWSIEAAGGGPMVSYLQTGSGMSECSGSSNTNDGAWHHYALVFDDAANTLKGYLDGDLDCSTTANFSLGSVTSGNVLYMGALDNGGYVDYYFEGALDEVVIYNRALSAGEVAALAATPAVSMGYVGEGSYLSGIIDLGETRDLSLLVFDATTPAGTTLAVDIRAGDTAVPPAWNSPSGQWPSGAMISNVQSGVTDNIAALGTRRYVQYRVRMTSNGINTPTLGEVSVHYGDGL